jgi:DNA-binding CsgD family transcriptional regulator
VNDNAARQLAKNPRVFWGRVVRTLIERGWRPPAPDERIVEDLIAALDAPVLSIDRVGEPSEDVLAALSAREREVVVLLIEGLTNDALADRLGVAPQTIKFHLTNVYRKLGCHSRAEVVARVLGA